MKLDIPKMTTELTAMSDQIAKHLNDLEARGQHLLNELPTDEYTALHYATDYLRNARKALRRAARS